jgi:UDP-N-acetylmuramyl tripeptide synthase
MGCGCKKKPAQPQNTPLPVEVNLDFSNSTVVTESGPVTEEQQTLINEIADKLKDIASSSEQ